MAFTLLPAKCTGKLGHQWLCQAWPKLQLGVLQTPWGGPTEPAPHAQVQLSEVVMQDATNRDPMVISRLLRNLPQIARRACEPEAT